jgi:dipeptidyl aminopeptidase/acylaminoacyl peptidase
MLLHAISIIADMQRRSFLVGAMCIAASYYPRPGSATQNTLGTIAHVQHDGLWIRELPDGHARKLISGSGIDSPHFSPSGKWITCFRDNVLHILSIEYGTDISLGTPDRGSVVPGAQWSHLRDELLVGGGSGLSVFSADSGWHLAEQNIHGATLPVAFSPDGKEIIFADELVNGRGPNGEPLRTGRLCRLKLREPASTRKVLGSKYLSGWIPFAWTRSNGSVIFWEDPEFSASFVADGLELFSIPAEGGHARSLHVSTLVHGDMLSFSPEQDKLVVCAGDGREEWEGKRIAVIDLRSGTISYLSDSGVASVCPAWSPDGATVAYSAAPGPSPGSDVEGGEEARQLLAKRRIWVKDAKGSSPKRLTDDSRYRDEEPTWSADGKHILFCRIADGNHKSLWLMRADGTGVVQVAGSLYIDPGSLGVDDSWFGYYGYTAWSDTFDWFRR